MSTTSNNNEIAIPQDYEQSSKYFRHYWTDIAETTELAKKEMINMVTALERSGFTRTQAIEKIVYDHKDLDGFSIRTIYRQLPDNMKDENVGRPKKQQQQLVQPNMSRDILVQPNNNNNNNNKLPTAYELSNNTDSTTTEIENIDDLEKYEQALQEPRQISQFYFRTMLSIKDQEIPVVVTVYPDKKTGYVEVDEKLARKLKKF